MLLRVIVFSLALAACAAPSGGPPTPGSVTVRMGGQVSTYVGAASTR